MNSFTDILQDLVEICVVFERVADFESVFELFTVCNYSYCCA